MFTRGLIILTFSALPALAETCATVPDRSAERAELLSLLSSSPNPIAGVSAANAVWAFWTKAPDETAQTLLDQGMTKIREANYAEAERILDQLVTYCPAYPEGWNQRAFARFLAERYDESLADINQALKLEPAHFGALSGQAMIYVRQGRAALAQIALRRAVAVHPWLQERAFIDDDGAKDI